MSPSYSARQIAGQLRGMQILHIPRQQRLDLIHGFRGRQVTRHASQPCMGFDPVGLGCLQRRVNHGAGVSAGHRVAEQSCLAANGERADRVLGPVVVDRRVAALSVACKLGSPISELGRRERKPKRVVICRR